MGIVSSIKREVPTQQEIEEFARGIFKADAAIRFRFFSVVQRFAESKAQKDILSIFTEDVAGQIHDGLVPKYSVLPELSTACIAEMIAPTFARVQETTSAASDFTLVQFLSHLPKPAEEQLVAGLLAIVAVKIKAMQQTDSAPEKTCQKV